MNFKNEKIRNIILLISAFVGLVIFCVAVFKLYDSRHSKTGRKQSIIDSPIRAAVVNISLEEVILALNAWDQIVSLPRKSMDNHLVKIIKPPQKAYTSFSETGEINFESLFSSHPNVILTWAGNTQTIKRLRELGLRTLTMHAYDFKDIYTILQMVGDALQKKTRSEIIRKDMQELLQYIESKTSGQRNIKVIWLGGTRTTIYGKKWIFHDIIEKAGAIDVTSNLSFEPLTAELSVEQIINLNPDVIIIGGWAPYSPKDILEDPQWAPVAAVRNSKVYKTPDKRANFSPYAALMAVMVAHWCYPEKITAKETLQLLDTYHTAFYGVSFSEVHPDFVTELMK